MAPPTSYDDETSALRRRGTSHRDTLERIHGDIRGVEDTRHVVPESSKQIDEGNVTTATDSEAGAPAESWTSKQKENLMQVMAERTCHDWMRALVPIYDWLQTYRWKDYLGTDILAGLTVGMMVIPQSMSYAKLAGLPVEFGLYSSLVPIYAYAVFGSSRQLAVGPVALVSLLLSNGITSALENKGITPDNTPDYESIYIALSLQTAVVVGICKIVMGVLKLGFVTIFLSHAVVSGFTSGAAIIIGFSQVKYILGYKVPNDNTLHKLLIHIFESIDQFNWKTFVLGSLCVIFLLGLKKFAQNYPKYKWTKAVGPLLVAVVTIVLQATIDLNGHGIPIIEEIPKGFPKFTGSLVFPLEDMGMLTVTVVSIVLIGFMESVAIAKQLANKHGYEVDSSLELFGLGVANLLSGFFGGYPVAGSFSRSAVNNEAGAKSGISGLVTATLVAFVLLFLTSVFELLPLAVLGSVVISGVVSLVDYPEAIYLWRVHKFDFAVWMLAFLGTLFLGAELGLAISVGISLLLVIFESAYPHTSVLGRLPGTHQYRNVQQYPKAELYDGIVMVRIDAPIYFANTQNVREKIQKHQERAQEELNLQAGSSKSVKFLILELSPVSHVDTSALHFLQEMHSTLLNNQQIKLCLANPNRGVMQNLVASGLVDEIGRENIFVSLHDAVTHCLHEMDNMELAKPTEIEEIMEEIEPSSNPAQNYKTKFALNDQAESPTVDV